MNEFIARIIEDESFANIFKRNGIGDNRYTIIYDSKVLCNYKALTHSDLVEKIKYTIKLCSHDDFIDYQLTNVNKKCIIKYAVAYNNQTVLEVLDKLQNTNIRVLAFKNNNSHKNYRVVFAGINYVSHDCILSSFMYIGSYSTLSTQINTFVKSNTDAKFICTKVPLCFNDYNKLKWLIFDERNCNADIIELSHYDLIISIGIATVIINNTGLSKEILGHRHIASHKYSYTLYKKLMRSITNVKNARHS